MKLNLGANDRRFDGFLSVDIAPPADIVCDLNQLPWPWPDSSVDEVLAYDVLEHLQPVGAHPAILIMNELWRVMSGGAVATIGVPSIHGAGFFQDPTHHTPVLATKNSGKYFEEGTAEYARFARHYGISARFKVLECTESSYQDRELVVKLHWRLQAVK